MSAKASFGVAQSHGSSFAVPSVTADLPLLQRSMINRGLAAPLSNEYNAPLVRPGDVTEQVWSDFLTLRKEKRAKLTPTALAGIRNAAEKAGYTLQAALALCCERGWQSFRAEWLAPPAVAVAGGRVAHGKTDALRERNRQNARQWLSQTEGVGHASV